MPESKSTKAKKVFDVPLPWSEGSLSAKLWQKGRSVVVGVPELDIFSTGKSQSEAVFRLFTTLLKYYQQLKASRHQLDERQQEHMRLLADWVESVEKKVICRELTLTR